MLKDGVEEQVYVVMASILKHSPLKVFRGFRRVHLAGLCPRISCEVDYAKPTKFPFPSVWAVMPPCFSIGDLAALKHIHKCHHFAGIHSTHRISCACAGDHPRSCHLETSARLVSSCGEISRSPTHTTDLQRLMPKLNVLAP